MIELECPAKYENSSERHLKLFLAGGIVGCEEWQQEVLAELRSFENLVVFNPRRKKFPIDDPNAAPEQIQWEFNLLNEANIISFWFSDQTIQPIVMYELGRFNQNQYLKNDKIMIIGVNPKYIRKADVEIQTRLLNPGIKIHDSLASVVIEIRFNVVHWDSLWRLYDQGIITKKPEFQDLFS